jgi:UDP-N-acetyl-D-galactosamine dehydrogenase
VVVAVPTPIDNAKQPDLTPVVKATETLAPHLKDGAIVIYESTVYPGVTEDVCSPIIERLSGKQRGTGFKLGYSPRAHSARRQGAPPGNHYQDRLC